MFRSRKDVDKHSQEIFRVIKDEKERNLRCLSIAQQYFNVRDYESARRYVTLYLSVKNESSVGHKLLGQCYEYFGDRDKALTEYKYSLQLDSKQPELILKVCELLADNSILVDLNQAKYWLTKGDSLYPHHPTVFKLKQKISSLDDDTNVETMESLIKNEMKLRSYDPIVHAKLLSFYIENSRIKDAYEEAFEKDHSFLPNLQWYQCGVQICKLYKVKFPNAINENFYTNYLIMLERTTALSVQDVKMCRKSIPECVSALARFDEVLCTAATTINKSERYQNIINYMSGQLCYLMANILYRKAKWEESSWQDITQLISPLLLLCTSKDFTLASADLKRSESSRFLNQCALLSTYRKYQASFVLMSMAKNSQKYFIEKVFHFCVANWRERIVERIYSTSDLKKFCESSFFVNNSAFLNLPSEFPEIIPVDAGSQGRRSIITDDIIEATELTQPASLHHLVWLGVQFLSSFSESSICEIILPPKFRVLGFSSLAYAHECMLSGYAETLCGIDIDAFLFACVYCAKSSQLQQVNSSKPFTPQVLPADVSRLLCSPEHEEWWECAYQMAKKTVTEENFSRVRSVLQRGIEAIRLIGNNTLPLPLLILLGRTFSLKATTESDNKRATALEARAVLYWEAALPLLKKIVLDDNYTFSFKSFFEYLGKVISPVDARKLISEGKRFLGMQQVKEQNYSESSFISETYTEGDDENPVPVKSSPRSSRFADDKIVQSMTDVMTKMMDRLDTLFNKQELLSSNQLQIFEMVSLLTKKVDDLLITNDRYVDSSPQTAQPLSLQNYQLSEQCNTNAESDKSLAASLHCKVNNSQVSFPTSNLRMNFSNFSPMTAVDPCNIPPLALQFPSVPNLSHNIGLPCVTFPSKYTPLTPSPFMFPSTSFGFDKPRSSNASSVDVTSVSSYPVLTTSVTVSDTSSVSSQPSMFGGFPSFLSQPIPDVTKFIPTQPITNSMTNNSSPLASLSAYDTTNIASPRPNLNNVSNASPFIAPPVFDSTKFASSQPVKNLSTSTASSIASSVNQSLFTFQNNVSTSTATSIASGINQSPFTFQNKTPTNHSPAAVHAFHMTIPESNSVTLQPPIEVPEQDEESDDGEYAEYDPIPDFKPIIPLPDEVVVKTCEEDEEVLFESRAKLFRFVDKEWKERGIGLYKILKNHNTGRVRVLMRREIVLKVCANHFLTDNLTLTPLKNSDRAWVYCAPDFSEEKMKLEKFCVKFKTREIASEFQQVFNKYKLPNVTESPAKKATPSGTFDNLVSDSTTLVKSSEKSVKKIVLASPVMKIEEDKMSKTIPTTEPNKTHFGGFTFTSKPIVSQPANQENEKVEDKHNTAFSSFTGFDLSGLIKPGHSTMFQSTTVPTTTEKSKVSVFDSSPFSSFATKNTVDFSSLSKSSSETSAFVKSKDFKGFAGAGSLVFGSGASQATEPPPAVLAILNKIGNKEQKTSATETTANANSEQEQSESTHDDSQNGNVDDEFVPTAEFKPVISLPELVEVKTGEEGLDVLYEDQCKLFRFVNSEWKERGIGKMKILRDPNDGSIRMLMRRDQVHKVCCNQRIIKDTELKPLKTTDKGWTWLAKDFSEGELTTELLCVRFKTVEQAQAFKIAFENAQKSLSECPPSVPEDAKSIESKEISQPKLSELFKPKEGSWTCDACYTSNTKDATSCVACETPKDGVAATKPALFNNSLFESNSTPVKYNFGFSESSKVTPTLNFGLTSTAMTTSGTSSLVPSVPLFSFGSTSAIATTASAISSSASPSISSFSFGSISTTVTTASAISSSASSSISTFSFGSISSVATTSSTASSSSTPSMPMYSFGSNVPKPGITGSSSVFNFGENLQFTFTPISSSPNVSGTSSVPLFPFGNSSSTIQKSVSGGLLFDASSNNDSKAEASLSPKNKQKKSSTAATNNVSIFSGTSINNVPKSTESSDLFKSFSFKISDSTSVSMAQSQSVANSNETTQDITRLCEEVPLLVEDENDVLLFKSSAGLFRYDCDEWKARGFGDIQVIKNSQINKLRLLMIREPGEVVCLNHYIREGIVFKAYDQYSWTWNATDFSEGEVVNEKFRLTFDNPNAATVFKDAVDLAKSQSKDAKISESSSTSSGEVEFISETQVTEEEKNLAESLQLPSNYYAYKYSNKTCPGCVGCEQEDVERKCGKQAETLPETGANAKDKPQELSSKQKNISDISSSDITTTNATNFVFGGSGDSGWLNKGSFTFGNVFSSNPNSPAKAIAEEESSDEEKDVSVVAHEHEPHFEPIIPLPDLVESKTGEEEETVLFRERSKLFRFDGTKKEWKERGVGDLKILYHPNQKSYRLLLRRDQVHKIVLNQRITSELHVEPLATSRNSWCWFGMNLTEESNEPVLEKLAARFRTEEIAKEFQQKVNDCVSKISEASEETNTNQVKETVYSQEDNDVKEDENSTSAAEEYENNYEDEDYGQYDASAEDYTDYEQDYYVDEQGIEDAMEDVDYFEGESDIVFEEEATLQVVEEDTAVDYKGIAKVVKNYDPDTDSAVAYVEFSTIEIPTLYKANIVKNSVAIIEGKCITFPNTENPELDGKVILCFNDEQLASSFFDIFDTMKLIDPDEDQTAIQEL